jgi:hypothetical protein
VRPVTAPFAAVFGVLVAAEEGYLGWLLWDAEPGWGWYLLVPAVLAAGALTGAGLVLPGRSPGRRVSGSAVLATFCLLPSALLQGPTASSRVVGGRGVLPLLVGPVGGLWLALQRPVRNWTRPAAARRLGRSRTAAR